MGNRFKIEIEIIGRVFSPKIDPNGYYNRLDFVKGFSVKEAKRKLEAIIKEIESTRITNTENKSDKLNIPL